MASGWRSVLILTIMISMTGCLTAEGDPFSGGERSARPSLTVEASVTYNATWDEDAVRNALAPMNYTLHVIQVHKQFTAQAPGRDNLYFSTSPDGVSWSLTMTFREPQHTPSAGSVEAEGRMLWETVRPAFNATVHEFERELGFPHEGSTRWRAYTVS